MIANTSDHVWIFLGNNFCEWHDYELSIQERIQHPFMFYAEMNDEIMYFHQALQQDDVADFVHPVVK